MQHFSKCAMGEEYQSMLPGIMTQGGGLGKVKLTKLDRLPSPGPRQGHYSGHCGSGEGTHGHSPDSREPGPLFSRGFWRREGLGARPVGNVGRPAVSGGWGPSGGLLWQTCDAALGGAPDDGDESEPSPSPQLSRPRTWIMLYTSGFHRLLSTVSEI